MQTHFPLHASVRSIMEGADDTIGFDVLSQYRSDSARFAASEMTFKGHSKSSDGYDV